MFKDELTRTIQADPLRLLNRSEIELIWKFRNHCSTIPEALPKLLRCIEWDNLDNVSTCIYIHSSCVSPRNFNEQGKIMSLTIHF